MRKIDTSVSGHPDFSVLSLLKSRKVISFVLNILNENGFYVNFISVYINMLSNTHKEMDGMREHVRVLRYGMHNETDEGFFESYIKFFQ